MPDSPDQMIYTLQQENKNLKKILKKKEKKLQQKGMELQQTVGKLDLERSLWKSRDGDWDASKGAVLHRLEVRRHNRTYAQSPQYLRFGPACEMRRPETTIHGWPARAMERDPDGLPCRKAPGRRTLLDEPSRWWLSELLGRGPRECGFRAGSWQSETILELIRRKFGISSSPRMLRGMLHKVRFPYRKPGSVPYNSAPGPSRRSSRGAHLSKRAGWPGTDMPCSAGMRRPGGCPRRPVTDSSHQRKRDSSDGIPNSVRQDVRDPGKGRTPRADSRGHELAHARGLSKVGAPEIPKIRARPGQRPVPQVGNGHET